MSTPAQPHVIEDCRGILQLLSDGTVVRRHSPLLNIPLTVNPAVTFKDTEYNSTHSLTLRIFKPTTGSHLPILIYFHGGGYCIGSYTWPHIHNAFVHLAHRLHAIIVAPDYRLAPENRLPAAIEDSSCAVEWVLSNPQDPFLENADFDNVFISGESAGGNITHHLGLRFGKEERINIRGYVMLQPMFGGVERTNSEANCSEHAFLTLEQSDRYWRLALPVGSNRDDRLANPVRDLEDEVEFGNVMVVVGEKDLYRDRGVMYGELLKKTKKNRVEIVEIEGAEHGFFLMDLKSDAAENLVCLYKQFIDENKHN